MKYIIRMSRNWKDILEDKENIVFLEEDVEKNTIEIEVEDIDNFTIKNNFHVEYEIFMPGLIKLGLNTVGVIVSPNYRNEEMEKLMAERLKAVRKRGISMHLNVEGEEYKSISSAIAGTILSIENGLNPGIREIIDKGKEEGKSPYESLKEAGYIKNPMDEFYSDLGKKEMPSVSDLINEIKKVDTFESIRLEKNLEENTLKDEEIKLIQELSKSVDWFVQTANIARKKEFKIKIEKTIDDLSDEQLIELLPKIDVYIDRLSKATLDDYQIIKYENLIKIIKKRLSL